MNKPNKPTSREEIINISGMHCNSCVELIEDKISPLEGVENIKVSLAENKAFVKFNPEKIGLNKIKSEISSLGYSADSNKGKKGDSTFLQGVAYALVPHIGCIAFITGSILGVTLLMEFFKPLLMNRWFFHILIAISLGFATLSSALYLRKNGLLSLAGAQRKWRYLSVMYGSTIGINLVLFMLIFPLLANVSVATVTGTVVGADSDIGDALIKMSVDIPCPGHAPLISEELKSIDGVTGIKFSFPNIFDVAYDSTKTSKGNMLSLDVFDEYPATVLEESLDSSTVQSIEQSNSQSTTRGGCGCGGSTCGGSGSCCGG